MKQKPALILSIVLTAFVLVILTTVVTSAKGFVGAIGGQSSNSLADTTFSEREQAYIDALNAANQQISEMQIQLNSANIAETLQGAPVSAEQALEIASAAAMDGFVLSGQPELVEFEGKVAYEIPFNDSFIYVDASTGEVLYNGTIAYGPQLVSASEAARIASDYMNRQDVTGVTLAQLNGQQVFRVVFANHDVVYVSQFGQLLQVQLASSGSSSGSSASTGRSHNDDDDNEHENNDD